MLRCLITGGAGFIGSHLAEELIAQGEQVTVIDDLSTGCLQNLAVVGDHPRFRFVQGSILDRDVIAELLAEADEVYHLAAVVGVGRVAQSAIQTIKTNLHGTLVLLEELARVAGGRQVRLLLPSSSEVYGNNPKPQWQEDDCLVFGPTTSRRWSYGLAKALDEVLALAYWREKGLPVVVVRLFNVSGPRQTGQHGMVLPRLVEAALAGGPLIVHDDGRQVRCFVHVADVVPAMIALMRHRQAIGGVYNIGSDEPVTILGLAHRVAAMVDPGLKIEFRQFAAEYGSNFEDCRRRVPDLGRLRQTIGFAPRHTLQDIIRDVVAWHRGQSSAQR